MQEQAQVWALRDFFLLLVLALALLCRTSELGQCKHKHKRNGSISCQRTKKTNGSSPTLTDTQDGNRIWRETLCLCKSLCLCLSHLCECPCAVIYACTYACLFACLLMSSQVENGGTLDVNGIYVHIGGIQWESVYQRPKGQCTIHKFTEAKLGCTSDHVIQYTKVILSFM